MGAFKAHGFDKRHEVFADAHLSQVRGCQAISLDLALDSGLPQNLSVTLHASQRSTLERDADTESALQRR
jgi:hypothetical protein